MKGVWVVKVGGRLCEDPSARATLARACRSLAHPFVLVHGGGDAVTRLQAALGNVPRFEHGRRVTSGADLGAVEMVLSGAVNPSLVRALQAAGLRAAGISGCDDGLVRCELVPGLGRVGIPAAVDVRLLGILLREGIVPVVSPVSLGPDGEGVNVNADELACALAAALGAERLLLVSDVDGVRVDGAAIPAVECGDVEALVESGEATGGMIPKLRAAARAVEGGVGEVRIGGFGGGSLLDLSGTRVLPAGSRAPEVRT